MNPDERKTSFERWPAQIVRISDIQNGDYIKVNEEFSPDYILINNVKVSRANIIAVVINSKADERLSTLTIDDGSGSIDVRDFDGKLGFSAFQPGHIVKVIGKPREFNGEIYLVGEIVRQLKNKRWIELRKLELENSSFASGQKPEEESNVVVEEEIIVEDAHENIIEKIITLIKEIDKGDGADIEEVIGKSKISGAELIISNLTKEGEIFEIRPGRIKVL